MPDFEHSYVGGDRAIRDRAIRDRAIRDRAVDDDRVRRLVIDAARGEALDADEIRAEYEAVPDAPRRGDNGEPVEDGWPGPDGER